MKNLNNKTSKFAKKVANQSQKVEEQFMFETGRTMKTKNSRGYRDHFGNAVSGFEHELRKNKHLAKDRARAITIEDQIKHANSIIAEDSVKTAESKKLNSEDAKLAARNAMNITKESVARKNAENGFKYITDEKGHAVKVNI